MRSIGTALHLDAVPHPRRLGRVFGAGRIIHPFPTLLNVVATAALSFIAARGVPESWQFAMMLIVMLCAQSAIGVMNDVFDRELDARTKPWKPIVAGLVSMQAAVALAIGLGVASVILAATLGPVGCALAVLGLGCGIAYDMRLKRTAFSAVPYMVGIPVLPMWVWAVAGDWRPAMWWLVPMGSLIGLALHLANTLPDIDGDASNGVRGLAHRLGERCSMLIAWASFASVLAVSGAIAPFVDYDLRAYIPTAAFGAACLVTTVALRAIRRDRFALQAGFAILGVGSAVLAAGWLAAI